MSKVPWHANGIGDMLIVAICGLICAVLIALCGCSPQTIKVIHEPQERLPEKKADA